MHVKQAEPYLYLLSLYLLMAICQTGIPPPPPPIPTQLDTEPPTQTYIQDDANNSANDNSAADGRNVTSAGVQATDDSLSNISKDDTNGTNNTSAIQSATGLTQNDSISVVQNSSDTISGSKASTDNLPGFSAGNETDATSTSDTSKNITGNATNIETDSVSNIGLDAGNETLPVADKVVLPETDSNITKTVSDLTSDTLSRDNATSPTSYEYPTGQNVSTAASSADSLSGQNQTVLTDSILDNNQTLSSDNASSTLTEPVAQPPITFSEQNGSTTVEISPGQFNNISFPDVGLLTENVTSRDAQNASVDGRVDYGPTIMDSSVSDNATQENDTVLAELAGNKTENVTKNVTQTSTPTPSSVSMVTLSDLTTRPTLIDSPDNLVRTQPVQPIEDTVSVDHPPPIFLDGRRPPTYTGPASGPFDQTIPEQPRRPQIQRRQSTAAPAPPPIFIPRRQTRPSYRIITTTTPTPPFRPVYTQVQTLRPELDPRYMTVAELAELALRNRGANQPKKANLVFFNTIEPLTPEPVVTTTKIPFVKQPDMVYKPEQMQTLPKPTPIAEPPKQFYDANYLLNQIMNQADSGSPSPSKIDGISQMQQSQQRPVPPGQQIRESPSSIQNVQPPFNLGQTGSGGMNQVIKQNIPENPRQQEHMQELPKSPTPDDTSFSQMIPEGISPDTSQNQQPSFQQMMPGSQPSVGQPPQMTRPNVPFDRQTGPENDPQILRPRKRFPIERGLQSTADGQPSQVSKTSSFDTRKHPQTLQRQDVIPETKQMLVQPQNQFIGQSQLPPPQQPVILNQQLPNQNQIQPHSLNQQQQLQQQQQQQRQQQQMQQQINEYEQQRQQLIRQQNQQSIKLQQSQPVNRQTQIRPTQKPFYDSDFLLRQIGLDPTEQVPVNTGMIQQSPSRPRQNVAPAVIPKRQTLPTRQVNRRQSMLPQKQGMSEVQGGQPTTRRPRHKQSSYTPYVKIDDLFTSQALEAWIKTMALKPGVLQQVQNDNRNRINSDVKVNNFQQPSSNLNEARGPVNGMQNTLRTNSNVKANNFQQPTYKLDHAPGPVRGVPPVQRTNFSRRQTLTTSRFESYTPRPSVTKPSVRQSFNQRSQDFETKPQSVPTFSGPRPREYVYGDGSSSNAGNAAPVSNTNNQIPPFDRSNRMGNNPTNTALKNNRNNQVPTFRKNEGVIINPSTAWMNNMNNQIPSFTGNGGIVNNPSNAAFINSMNNQATAFRSNGGIGSNPTNAALMKNRNNQITELEGNSGTRNSPTNRSLMNNRNSQTPFFRGNHQPSNNPTNVGPMNSINNAPQSLTRNNVIPNSQIQNPVMSRTTRSSPEMSPHLDRPMHNSGPQFNHAPTSNNINDNKAQQFPLAQRLGFANVLADNPGLNNMNFNQMASQMNFQPNIITNTGARSRMIPARTLEDMKSHWSSKAGNSIKLPVDQVPYFLRQDGGVSTGDRPAQIEVNARPSDMINTRPSDVIDARPSGMINARPSEMITPNIPYRFTTTTYVPLLMIRYTTTTTLPTPPPTVDPNPPPIFDTKMLRTFMPMPQQEFTTGSPVEYRNYQGPNFDTNENRTSIPGYDDRCINCTFVNDRCLLPDPVHCNMFIECVRQGAAVRGFNRECALGSFFDRKSYLCVDPKNTDCPQDRCREPGLKWYPIHGHCKHYWSCASREGGGIYAQSECCPDMGGFIETEGCVENRNCTESCDSTIVTSAINGCHLRKTTSPTVYFDTNPNIERPCAPGTLFNEQKCTCEQDIAIERSDARPGATTCLPMLNITFDNNTIVDTSLNKQHIGEEGIATTPSGEGIFNGVGRLILWRYANLMFPVVFAVQFRFATASSGPRFQTVISNCNPNGGRDPTFDITLDTKYHEVIFKVDTLESPISIFKETYQHNKDTTVVLIYDGERIVGSVDNRARNIIARGGIETRPNPISVGACGGREGFNGLLDDLAIYEDCIPDEMYGIFMSVLE